MSDAPRTPKEAVYDEHISPLMAQIIALCKEHRINMAAQFSLGLPEGEEGDDLSPLYCTTCLPVDETDEEGHERIVKLGNVMKPPAPRLYAFTITSGKRP